MARNAIRIVFCLRAGIILALYRYRKHLLCGTESNFNTFDVAILIEKNTDNSSSVCQMTSPYLLGKSQVIQHFPNQHCDFRWPAASKNDFALTGDICY